MGRLHTETAAQHSRLQPCRPLVSVARALFVRMVYPVSRAGSQAVVLLWQVARGKRSVCQSVTVHENQHTHACAGRRAKKWFAGSTAQVAHRGQIDQRAERSARFLQQCRNVSEKRGDKSVSADCFTHFLTAKK